MAGWAEAGGPLPLPMSSWLDELPACLAWHLCKGPLRSLCQAGWMKQRVRIHRQAPQPVSLFASAWCLCACVPQEAFPTFFQHVLALQAEHGDRMRMHEKVAYLVFAINAFQVCCAVCSVLVRVCEWRVRSSVCSPIWCHIAGGC